MRLMHKIFEYQTFKVRSLTRALNISKLWPKLNPQNYWNKIRLLNVLYLFKYYIPNEHSDRAKVIRASVSIREI
jgi:hypothetical protein